MEVSITFEELQQALRDAKKLPAEHKITYVNRPRNGGYIRIRLEQEE
jgi:hypothetical protein